MEVCKLIKETEEEEEQVREEARRHKARAEQLKIAESRRQLEHDAAVAAANANTICSAGGCRLSDVR